MLCSTPFPFTVTRHEPELLAPARATPRGLRLLSNIDDQESLRFFIPLLFVYPAQLFPKRDPARVLRDALAEALVYYYPFAGRLREGPARKLAVDSTAEGVVFVEADSPFTLEDLRREGGGFLRPPFPTELYCEVPGTFSGALDSPLLLFQVTRFRCGGFSFSLQLNHVMTDAAGLIRFIHSVAELARGASRPSVLPVWGRQLLLARDPPRVTCTHKEYRQVDGPVFPLQYIDDVLIERSFFFGPAQLSALRRRLPPHLSRCSTFDLLSAFLWRCRTVALRFDPGEEVRYMCLVNIRPRLNPPLPAGYYGNAFVFPAAESTVGELSENGLGYAVELIKKAKAEATEEYTRSVTDLMATQGKPNLTVPGSWVVSDNTRAAYLGVDFGLGKPEYAGPSSAMVGGVSGPIGFFVKGVNGAGESGVFLLICLPATAMERFAREVERTNASSNFENLIQSHL